MLVCPEALPRRHPTGDREFMIDSELILSLRSSTKIGGLLDIKLIRQITSVNDINISKLLRCLGENVVVGGCLLDVFVVNLKKQVSMI